ncbi:MAG: class I mannose-6-phosphate isomerase [Candidatus Hydrogenedentes bacterium]|nr:class I mannose-6-phosphate isomerase [Candidatus Hydrogenedentota bacterium]
MTNSVLPALQFEEAYFERIWGGQKLHTRYGKPIPSDRAIGEAWLISDHPLHGSRVASGPLQGQTLRQLLARNAAAVLGSRATLTKHGRFPLLLKLLDAADYLSVQVHPDDACAAALNEPDVGKTEMWHVLEADSGSELICGLVAGATPDTFRNNAAADLEPLLCRFQVQAGDSVFVPAGTVHAIGKGIVLAEIQQNSDLTYRLYDWGRLQLDGKPRDLHIEKSIAATHFGSHHSGVSFPLSHYQGSARRTVLAACSYFAAERIESTGTCQLSTKRESFHIALATEDQLHVSSAEGSNVVARGQAILIPGSLEDYEVTCAGPFLLYYVPDIVRDVVTPLQDAGHPERAIEALLAQE